jgi:hypothetical protein
MRLFRVIAAQLSAVITISLITFMAIYAELSKGFKDFLVGLSGHHWVSKGIISLIVFFGLTIIVSAFIKGENEMNERLNYLVILIVLLGSIAIFGFFVLEFLA